MPVMQTIPPLGFAHRSESSSDVVPISSSTCRSACPMSLHKSKLETSQATPAPAEPHKAAGHAIAALGMISSYQPGRDGCRHWKAHFGHCAGHSLVEQKHVRKTQHVSRHV